MCTRDGTCRARCSRTAILVPFEMRNDRSAFVSLALNEGTLGKVRFAINRTIISSSVSSSRWEDGVAREGRAFFLSPRNIERYRVEAHARNRERERRERSVWKGAGETVARRSRWTERCPACATGDEADLEERGNRRDPRAAALYRPRRPTTATKRARSD